MTAKPCRPSARHPADRSRRGPRRRRPAKLHADKGHYYPHLRRRLHKRGIIPRLARRGIENSTHLGRHRWVVERAIAWLIGCGRLHRRYQHKPDHFLALTEIAAALICYRSNRSAGLLMRAKVWKKPFSRRRWTMRQPSGNRSSRSCHRPVCTTLAFPSRVSCVWKKGDVAVP